MAIAKEPIWQWNHAKKSYKIYYLEKGSGNRHLVLIHGFGGNSYTWRYLLDALAQAGYHVWSLDLIGFGQTDKPDLPYGKDLFVDQVNQFMEAQGINSATLVGNSMGGGIALTMAIEHPKKVESLILIDPLAFPVRFPYYFAIPKIFGNLTKPFFGRMLTKAILTDIMYNPQKITEEQITAYTLPLQMKGGREAFIKTLQSFSPAEFEQLSKHYKELQIPLLVIWGREDRLMKPSYRTKFHLFPNAKIVEIPFCGHIPQEECPQPVIQAILNFD